jgi:serine/threonine-protein kinase
MPQPRASRLSKPGQKKSPGKLQQWLPLGSTRRKIVLWGVVPLIIALCLLLIVDGIVMPIVTRHGTEFPLPDFVGQPLTQAQVSLNELDLRYGIASEEYSPGEEAGIILGQFPVAGTKVKDGREIKFVVSLGRKLVPVPDLSGQSVRQAMLDLETAGLKLGEIAWAFSDTLPEKVVVFSYPATETEVPLGSEVNLMVNRGRASSFTYVPRVVGLPLAEAEALLADKQLKVGIVNYRTDENYLPETVLEQSETEGTELDIGTEIDLVVSTTE